MMPDSSDRTLKYSQPPAHMEQGAREAARDSEQLRAKLQAEIESARLALREAERGLAEEQAAVNAFRMHCRLKLDAWIDRLLALQTSRQSLLTRLRLARESSQEVATGGAADFWADEEPVPSAEDGEEILLPTDTPADKAAEKRLYRELARRFHPDLGVTAVEVAYRTQMMSAVNRAYDSGDLDQLYDLAGELNPEAKAALDRIEGVWERKERLLLAQLQRRRRRIKRQHSALRRENTARLWRRARHLEESGADWWEVVRREIERVIGLLEPEIDRLRSELRSLEAADGNIHKRTADAEQD